MSIPLKSRKAIKEAIPLAEAEVLKASNAIGVTLTFDDNTADLWAALGEAKGDTLGPALPKYFVELAKTFAEFSKDASRKEALVDALNAVGGKVRLVMVPANNKDVYFSFAPDAFCLETKPNYWGSWLSSFNAENLEKIMRVDYQGANMPLLAKRKLMESMSAIESEVKRASGVFGSSLTWDVNYGDVWKHLGNDSKASDFGVSVVKYAKQFGDALGEFFKNATRKEAFLDALTTGRVGFSLAAANDKDVYWVWKDGAILMQIKPSYWGSWISSFNADNLEKVMRVNFHGADMPLEAKRKLVDSLPAVEAEVSRASKAYGTDLVWDVNYGDVWRHLANDSRAGDFGVNMAKYAKTFADTFIAFVANADNKEAVQEALTSNKIGFVLAGPSDKDVYWIWKDGGLNMQIKTSYWGSWLGSYNAQALEKTL